MRGFPATIEYAFGVPARNAAMLLNVSVPRNALVTLPSFT
jgi:hypothetical protein